MHTHDTTGVVHIEASQPSNAFTLGAFLDLWGVSFTGDQLGGYHNTQDKAVHVYANGQPITDPRPLPAAPPRRHRHRLRQPKLLPPCGVLHLARRRITGASRATGRSFAPVSGACLECREMRQACGDHSPVASPQVALSHISSHTACLASALSPPGETVDE